MATYAQFSDPKPQYVDENSDPYSGGKLYFYKAGTSTPLTVYKTSSGTAHASPIVLDTEGRIADSDGVFVPTDQDYKVILHDSSDVEVFSIDNLSAGIDVSNISDGTITLAKLEDLSANTVIGSVAGGAPEEITMTAAGRALMDDANAAAQLVTLGITATAAELNVLDGIPGTLTATELGYLDGVTSGIQAQIDALGGGNSDLPYASYDKNGTQTGIGTLTDVVTTTLSLANTGGTAVLVIATLQAQPCLSAGSCSMTFQLTDGSNNAISLTYTLRESSNGLENQQQIASIVGLDTGVTGSTATYKLRCFSAGTKVYSVSRASIAALEVTSS